MPIAEKQGLDRRCVDGVHQPVKGCQGQAEKRFAMQIDTRFPLNKLNELARMESYNKHYYRPPNYLHKWWARRLGSGFRTIILGTFLEGDQDAWEAYFG